MKKENQNIIEIQEEVSIAQEDGTKVILEKGDKVEVLEQKASTIDLSSLINILSSVNKQEKSVSQLLNKLMTLSPEDNPLYLDEWQKLFNKYNI